MTLLVACHDAGGAEIVSAWLARREDRAGAACLLAGPAAGIFARKLGSDLRQVGALPSLDGVSRVVCGSSGDADLERRVVRAARAAGVPSAVWLDHWVAYARRFELGGEVVRPDEVWVTDEHAARLAAAALPGATVVVRGNPYLEDAVAEVRAHERPRADAGERILWVSQPVAAGARRETGDPRGWGYDEHEALARFLALLDRAGRPAAVRVRAHPAEPAGAHDAMIAAWTGRLAVEPGPHGAPLAADIAWADTVAGCDTMAMVVALHAGRRTVSAIPPGGRPLTLPFPRIERLHDA